MTKGNTTENDVLNYIFNEVDLPWSATADNDWLCVHLHTGNPDEAGISTTNECNYTNYVKVGVRRNNTGWTVAGNTTTNATVIAFPQCGVLGNTVTHVSITPSRTTQ